MTMVYSVCLEEPRIYSNGISWVLLGVYFSILMFCIRYESMSLTYKGLSLYKKVKHFEFKTNKSILALV